MIFRIFTDSWESTGRIKNWFLKHDLNPLGINQKIVYEIYQESQCFPWGDLHVITQKKGQFQIRFKTFFLFQT